VISITLHKSYVCAFNREIRENNQKATTTVELPGRKHNSNETRTSR